MYEYTLKWDDLKNKSTIKKGDRFYCTNDVKMMFDGDIAYKKGKTYISEKGECITDEQGYVPHFWEEDWTDYFIPTNAPATEKHCINSCDCKKCNPDKDYFQSISEEHAYSLRSDKRTFESGAVRDNNEGKSRPDLISPYFTERLGFRLAEGAKKYKERNWEKGIPDEAFLESLERHLIAHKMGKTDEDHAAAIAFNIMGIIHNEEVRKLKDF